MQCGPFAEHIDLLTLFCFLGVSGMVRAPHGGKMCLAAIKYCRRTVAVPTHGQARVRLGSLWWRVPLPQDLLHLLAPRQLVHPFVEVADFAHHRLGDLFHADAADHALDL